MARSGVFVAVFITLVATASAQHNSGVYATNNEYHPDQIGWSLYTASAYCATYDGDKPLSWRKQYKWTAFCDANGPPAPQFCGRCLKVRNEDGGAHVTVRIVDQCDNGGLDLDTSAFDQIDSDGHGYAQGHLHVDYQFVDC